MNAAAGSKALRLGAVNLTAPGGEHYLSIVGEGRRPTRVHLLAEGESAGLPAKRRETILEEVAAAVDQWPKLAAVAGMPPARTADIRAVLIWNYR